MQWCRIFYHTSLQVPSCFFTFFQFNPTTFPFLMFFIYLSKVEACQKINELMLESLETDKIELACVDVVDESGSTAKFDKKQEKN